MAGKDSYEEYFVHQYSILKGQITVLLYDSS